MKRVVIIGNGMAGHRVAAEVHSRRPEWGITVIGAETHPAYNRVLLTNLLAGRATERSIVLPEHGPGVTVLTGRRVHSIDRAGRTVSLGTGLTLGYDRLVLATGGLPFMPPIKGMVADDGRTHPGVVAFRTLEDCAAIVGLAEKGRRALVLGGGLLGLEAARGLAERGLDVHVLHAASHLMERQLDAPGGKMLARALAGMGITTWTDAGVTKVLGEARPPRSTDSEPDAIGPADTGSADTGTRSPRLTGVELADGRRVPGDLLVVACGTRPDTDLAAAAGLETGRGVLVDDWLRTSDPDIHAVGDCAEHRGVVHGLVAPAWEQARVAAETLTGANRPAPYEGSRLVARLKAKGVDLAAMGETQIDEADGGADTADTTADTMNGAGGGTEVIRYLDSGRGTYQKVVLRDNRVIGALLLGDTSTAGTVTRLFDQGAPAPRDRRLLLFPELAESGAKDAGALPGDTVICQCNGVTKDAVMACREAGAKSVEAVAARTRATTGCGGCRPLVEELLDAQSS
ncbi:FAD-dependent oxidoreductase [Streptomyces sp. NPDC006368]|uniref:FAD-dependent oxidoreductase n=1 Tax=Streptomyces sp. NPDC006368 TaxID=3156760 RepID=UPI0033BF51F5